MPQKDNILKELQELKSELAEISRQNLFQVPVGYFDGLAAEILKKVRTIESGPENQEADFSSPLAGNHSKQIPFSTPAGYFDTLPEQILKRVKLSEAGNAADELASLSPLLSSLSKRVPYAVPAGYFDTFEKKLEQIIIVDSHQTAQEELATISPLLNGLNKKTTYTVPDGYFENLQPASVTKNGDAKAKVVSITSQKWFRYAAAALVIGFVATIGFTLINKPERIDPSVKSFAWVQKNMKKVSTDDINEFVELASVETPAITKTDANEEINSLLKDVSDKEIQDFLIETQTAETETDDDLILN